MAVKSIEEISLPAAARILGISWSAAYQYVLTGHLVARQGDNGRWLVSRASVERLEKNISSIAKAMK